MTQDEIEIRVARLLQAQQDRDKIKELQSEVARLKAELSEIIHKETQFNGGVIVSDEKRVRLLAIVEKGTYV